MIYDYLGLPTYSLIHIHYPILSQKEFEQVVIMHPKRYIKTMWLIETQGSIPIKNYLLQATPDSQILCDLPIIRLEDITLDLPDKADLCLMSSTYLRKVYKKEFEYYD